MLKPMIYSNMRYYLKFIDDIFFYLRPESFLSKKTELVNHVLKGI